jgi:hypothetical protein
MSGAPPVVPLGEAEGSLLYGVVVNRTLELLAAQHRAEHRTTGLQHPAGAERSYRYRVIAEAIDECADRGYGVWIIASNTKRTRSTEPCGRA